MVENYGCYLDFLSFLYKNKKHETHFSYEYITQKIGLKSKSNVYRIFKGERKLSPVLAIRLCKLLGLSDTETDYFLTLLFISDGTTDVEKRFLINKRDNLQRRIIREKQIQVAA